MSATKPELTPAEALQMLASALSYLKAAGLTVKAGNHQQLGLVLAIGGAHVQIDPTGVTRFEPVTLAIPRELPVESCQN